MFKSINTRKGWPAVALLAAALTALPTMAADQPTDPAFDDFFSNFKDAVAHKDEAALRKVMAPDFSFIRATNVSWDKVFQGLAADQGRQWANLQQSVQGQPMVDREPGQERPVRVLRCTPTEGIYNCLVVFTQDTQERWRWQGMIMPPR